MLLFGAVDMRNASLPPNNNKGPFSNSGFKTGAARLHPNLAIGVFRNWCG